MRTSRLIAAGVVLSGVDAACSLHRAGQVTELNPLLRPLLACPLGFLVAKAVLTAAGLIVLGRLAASARSARISLAAAIVVYAALDVYWVGIGLSVSRRCDPRDRVPADLYRDSANDHPRIAGARRAASELHYATR